MLSSGSRRVAVAVSPDAVNGPKTSMAMLNFKHSTEIARGERRGVQQPNPKEDIWKNCADPDDREMILWVLDEPFEFGVLPMQPSTKINLSYLRKVSEYIKTKNMYPVLNLQSWLHISQLKLQMGEHIPWIYLRLFDILKQQMKRDDKSVGYWDFRCEQLRKGREDTKDEFRVPTFEFLVFLYIQNSYKIMKRMSAQMSTQQARKQDARWAIRSNEHKIQNENLHFQYLYDNIEELIDFLQEGYKTTEEISLTIIEALNLIFCCTTNPRDCVMERLEIVVTQPKICKLVHFNPDSQTVNRSKFINWVRNSLTLNPWSSASSFVHCPKIYPPTGTTRKDSKDAPTQNRVLFNQKQPPYSSHNFRWAVVSNVCNQVYYHSQSMVGEFCNLKIHRCNNSFLYAPGVYNCICIDKCVNSTIFLGASSKVVKFVGCTNIKVYSVARLVLITDCIKSTFFLLTPSPPILTGTKNDNIQFGPYNTFYPSLKDDMNHGDLKPNVSNWNCPIQIAFDGLSAVSPSPVMSFINPADFYLFNFPFEMPGNTVVNPLLLPDEYQQALDVKSSRIKELENVFMNTDLPASSQAKYKRAIFSAFRAWLSASGSGKELDGLLNLEKKVKQIRQNHTHLENIEPEPSQPEFLFSDFVENPSSESISFLEQITSLDFL